MTREHIHIAEGIEIPASAASVEMSRASGPGGQHVNKTETRVTLRLDLLNAPISEGARARILEKIRPRLTKAGEILVSSDQHRERERNLDAAFDRLEQLLQEAYRRDPPRKKTKPSRGQKERRLRDKNAVKQKKKSRERPRED